MLKFFRFKKHKSGSTQLILREKKTIYYKPKEKYISKKGSILLFGIEASGKTKRLKKFIEHIDDLFPKETKIIFKATDSLSEILNKNLDGDEETQKLLILNPDDLDDIENLEDVLDVKNNMLNLKHLMKKQRIAF